MVLTTAQALQLFYARLLPHSIELPFILLVLYGTYLLIASAVLLFALKAAGAKVNITTDFPRAILTIVVRDMIAIPVIAMIFFAPIIGIIAAFAIWLGMLRFIFQVTWLQAAIAWVSAGIIQIILIILVIIPVFLLL